METVQDMESDPGPVRTDCLEIPLILQALLQQFSNSELLKLSLVNKQWNYEARSLMRNRGNLSVIINKNQICQDLRAFASDLRRMKETPTIVPFSGMTISLGGWQRRSTEFCHQPPTADEMEPFHQEILGSLPWKHLSIVILYEWAEYRNCPGMLFTKKILQNFAWALQEFSIGVEYDAPTHFVREYLQDCRFTRLKTFRLENETGGFIEMIKTVVSRAPNLQVFYSTGMVELQEDILEGSSAIHLAAYPYCPSTDHFPENITSALKMQEMDLIRFGAEFSLEKFNRITRALLDSSRTTMSTMHVDVALLLPLMVYGVCLENVRTFELGFSNFPLKFEKRKPEIWRLAKCFDFTRIFPKLTTVTISQHDYGTERIPNEFYQIFAQGKAGLENPLPDRAANIKELILEELPDQVYRRRSSFRLFAQMFPDVEKLTIETTDISFANLRGIWVGLKEVDVALRCLVSNLKNLDSVFCGIYPEEVALLREQDEEFLRRVNIVPVMRSLAYLKELRNFTVFYNGHFDRIDEHYGCEPYSGPTDDPTFTFSKVTGLIAFQRSPNLTVTFKTKERRIEQALSHLRPYGSVMFKERFRRS